MIGAKSPQPLHLTTEARADTAPARNVRHRKRPYRKEVDEILKHVKQLLGATISC